MQHGTLEQPITIRPLVTSEVARLADVTPATIRSWDRRGVLHPMRTPSGVRIYDRAEVERVIAARRQAEERELEEACQA